jgi:hypothetical protein
MNFGYLHNSEGQSICSKNNLITVRILIIVCSMHYNYISYTWYKFNYSALIYNNTSADFIVFLTQSLLNSELVSVVLEYCHSIALYAHNVPCYDNNITYHAVTIVLLQLPVIFDVFFSPGFNQCIVFPFSLRDTILENIICLNLKLKL